MENRDEAMYFALLRMSGRSLRERKGSGVMTNFWPEFYPAKVKGTRGEEILNALGIHRNPDLTIMPLGVPYLYRWRLTPRGLGANVFLHVQCGSDPERPLHDHPWDNQSIILFGGYDEILDASCLTHGDEAVKVNAQGDFIRHLRQGSVVHRKAEDAHRLILPSEIPYTISLFTTGPKVREWGFYMPEGWTQADKVIAERDF